jgi:two-component system chemotaxis sensor kinase CheA
MDPADAEALRQTFVAEATEHLDEIEGALIELETRPADRALLQQIFRVAHTFKGAAGSLGLRALADLAHGIEDVIEDLEQRDAPARSEVCGLLLEGVDVAREMLSDALAGVDRLRPAAEDLLRRLKSPAQAAPYPRGRALDDAGIRREHASRGHAPLRTVRVEVAKLDRMADLIGEIAVGRTRIGQLIRKLGAAACAALLDDLEQAERHYAELEEVIQTVRMVRVGPWLQQYARAIRDMARAHGKEARLVVEGGDVEADMAMVERLRDPMTHLIRNAVDHGIERPEVRRERGKDPTGTVTLSAWHEGGGIALRIVDDGAGLSRAQIAGRARARGSAVDPEALSAEELYRLVYQPGFSTAGAISDLSGRGMGLAVVRQRIDSLRGSIRIESAEGAGASFTIRLPLTLATIEGLSVEAASERYVIPLDAVVECIDLPPGELSSGRLSVLNVRGRALPCAELRELFTLEGPPPQRRSVVVVGYDGQLGGLVVDALHSEGRTVIKPLGPLFQGIPGISGSTILGDGRVALILDVATLLGDVAPRRDRRATPD